MVRLKHRYLLVHILYPSPDPSLLARPSSTTLSTLPIPDIVRFHQPTSDALTPPLLIRTIRAEIAALYGDYGVGLTSSRLTSRSSLSLSLLTNPLLLYIPISSITFLVSPFTSLPYTNHSCNESFISQVPIHRDFYVHHPSRPRSLSVCLGCAGFHDEITAQCETLRNACR